MLPARSMIFCTADGEEKVTVNDSHRQTRTKATRETWAKASILCIHPLIRELNVTLCIKTGLARWCFYWCGFICKSSSGDSFCLSFVSTTLGGAGILVEVSNAALFGAQ
ncbi:hypothetical protein T265_03398 [Opisthorchis viverrini]|uniref:Uncharacterized protein n=1 Tax=Opisthorchis viverrini TaxID=6198 RepID=A0A075AHM4_OPIVI|nr:hypothetical protein T265_03398 [Opisthorchis viverrini]KER30139.1 hypothetical protein T265_03398 [Opisthorchis viverrini]